MSTQRHKLEALQRRADYLAKLIANDSHRNRDYEKQELAALLWAVNVLKNHISSATHASLTE